MKIGILTRELTADNSAIINGIPISYLNILDTDIYPIFINTNIKLSLKNKENLINQIKSLDGFILPGGEVISQADLFIIDYCYKNNIPLLGICLGMQEIAYYFDNKSLKKLNSEEHFKPKLDYVHSIKLNKKGYLYNLLQTNTINVNSKHHYHITKNKHYVIEATSDKIIEAIKIKNTKYMLGLQFHPETMYPYDNNAKLIINDFFKACKN